MADAAPASASSIPPRPPLLILYGSQTGCAQEVAERIAREARFEHFARVRCTPMDSFDRRLLPSQPLVLFVCSTTGQGEAPDNMRGLYRFLLRRDLPADSLSGVRTAVFGLGDSSYPLFNAIARRLSARLAELGATALLPRGLGDDQADRGVDSELDPWLSALWAAMLVAHPLPPGISVGNYKNQGEPMAKYEVQVLRGEAAREAREKVRAEFEATTAAATASSAVASPHAASSHAASPHAASSSPIAATASSAAAAYTPPLIPMAPFLSGTSAAYTPLPLRVISNRRLTPSSHWQDVREIELEIPSVEEQRRRGAVVTAPPARPAGAAAAATAVAPPLSPAHRAAGVFAHAPGDVLFVHPRNPPPHPAIRAWIERHYDLDYENDWVRIVPMTQWKREQRSQQQQAAMAAAGDREASSNGGNNGTAMDLVMTPRSTDANGGAASDSYPASSHPASAPVALANGAEPDADDEEEPSEYPLLCSVRDLFEQHLDWTGTPRRFFFEQLSHFASSEMEKEKLQELASPEFHADFSRYVTREKRMAAEVLVEFKTAAPRTLGQLVTIVGRMQPRQFSIASCLDAHPQRIQLLVAILEIQTPFKRTRTGVCSEFFRGLDSQAEGGAWVHAWIKRPASGAAGLAFRPPSDPSLPVVLIGPGTGIAAFRAMSEARALWKAEQEQRTFEAEPFAITESEQAAFEAQEAADRSSLLARGGLPESTCSPLPSPSLLPHTPPPYLVLFGNRNRSADFFWRGQWEQLERQERAVEFHAVFSRDEEPTSDAAAADDTQLRSRYVQHVLERDCGLDVARRLARGGVIMVAGSAKGRMTRDVRAAVQRILQRYGTGESAAPPDTDAWTEAQAVEYLKLMDRQRRYAVEAW